MRGSSISDVQNWDLVAYCHKLTDSQYVSSRSLLGHLQEARRHLRTVPKQTRRKKSLIYVSLMEITIVYTQRHKTIKMNSEWMNAGEA